LATVHNRAHEQSIRPFHEGSGVRRGEKSPWVKNGAAHPPAAVSYGVVWRRQLAVVVWVLGLAAQGVAQESPPWPLGLVVTHADGRVSSAVLSTRPYRSWTPYFPRVPDWRDEPGVLPVRALDIRALHQGDTVRLDISVLRGDAREVVELIDTVVLRTEETATIEGLRRVGLMPIALAIKPVAPPALHVPTASSAVDGLTIDLIEPVFDPVPAYRVTIRNVTETPVVTIAFDTFSQGRRRLAGQQGHQSAQALVAPAGAHTFTIRLSGGVGPEDSHVSATPLDDVLISAALWADGRRDGDPIRTRDLKAVHIGRLTAVEMMLRTVREAVAGLGDDPQRAAGHVAAAIGQLPGTPDAVIIASVLSGAPIDSDALSRIMATGTQQARRDVVSALTNRTRAMSADEAKQWLRASQHALEAWHLRLVPLVRPD